MNTRSYSIAALCLLLCACSNNGADSFRETFGLNRKGPDEFQVVSRPPLSVPPEFNLVAPKQGADFVPAISAEDQAHKELLGTNTLQTSAMPGISSDAPKNPLLANPVPTVASGDLPSGADSQFLSDAGANQANPHIRQQIEEDNDNGVVPKKEEKYLFGNPSNADPEVDPAKETKRLKDDKAKNLPPTTGDTPTIQQPTTLLGSIFR